MGALGTTFVDDLLKLIFNGAAIANLADNAASSPLTNLYMTLHTLDPAAGNQTTGEISYTSFARVAIARSSGAFNVASGKVILQSDVVFPAPTGAVGQLAAYASIGYLSSGAGKIICRGLLNGPLTIALANAPRVLRGSSFSFV